LAQSRHGLLHPQMSAFGGKADITCCDANVRFRPEADIDAAHHRANYMTSEMPLLTEQRLYGCDYNRARREMFLKPQLD
jgi:hypothetical protein